VGAAMNSDRSRQAQRCNALHVEDAELEHFEPMARMFNAGYWRRVRAIKAAYELSHQQGTCIAQILQRLGEPVE
jgi:hypothetical protein